MIEKALSENFKIHGVNINEEQISSLLNDSNLKLYLDAFDEVEPKYRDELVLQIEKNCS